jgi:hypothetical protein
MTVLEMAHAGVIRQVSWSMSTTASAQPGHPGLTGAVPVTVTR